MRSFHFIILLSFLTSALFTGCAQKGGVRDNDAVAQVLKDYQGDKEVLPKDIPVEAIENGASPLHHDHSNKTAAEIENLTIDEVIRIEEPNTQNLYDNSRYDFPITVNSRVEGWIDYFTGRGRNHMERYLGRSSRYIPRMKLVFKNAGLPEDLVYLALIESGFNLKAKSRARAVGPWQFIKGTGKRYGLRVDSWVDERRDPILATQAAANYLKDLYLMFESWYLAASAYNAGEYKILRAIEQLKTNNYWRISETRAIRRETKDYIPKLIAAAIIAKNPARYGFDEVTYLQPLEFDTLTVDFPIRLKEIAKLVDADAEDLMELNPHYVHEMVPPHGGPYEIRVPPGTRVVVERGLASLRSGGSLAYLPKQHTVKSGDTLASISRQYRMRTRDLANANNLSPKEKLTPGMNLVIPGGGEKRVSEKNPARTAKPERTILSTPDADGFIIHRVKAGESLWAIAEKYEVTVQNIFKWNNLTRSAIHPGKALKIKASNPSPSAPSDSAVSAKPLLKKS